MYPWRRNGTKAASKSTYHLCRWQTDTKNRDLRHLKVIAVVS